MEDTKTTMTPQEEHHETGEIKLKEWATLNLKATPETPPPSNEVFGGEGVGLLEAIYGVMFQPVATLRQLGGRGRFRWGLLIFALILLFDQVVVTATMEGPYWEAVVGVSAGSLFIALYPILMGIVFAAVAVLHACAVLLGGKGHFRGFFAATAFAALPMVFLSLLSFWEYIGGSSPNLVITVLSLLISLWILVLQTLAIRESHSVSTGKAILIVFLPLIFLLGTTVWLVSWGMALLPHPFELPKP
jgi:hypothetical protein